jgi:hypothetical protein
LGLCGGCTVIASRSSLATRPAWLQSTGNVTSQCHSRLARTKSYTSMPAAGLSCGRALVTHCRCLDSDMQGPLDQPGRALFGSLCAGCAGLRPLVQSASAFHRLYWLLLLPHQASIRPFFLSSEVCLGPVLGVGWLRSRSPPPLEEVVVPVSSAPRSGAPGGGRRGGNAPAPAIFRI